MAAQETVRLQSPQTVYPIAIEDIKGPEDLPLV